MSKRGAESVITSSSSNKKLKANSSLPEEKEETNLNVLQYQKKQILKRFTEKKRLLNEAQEKCEEQNKKIILLENITQKCGAKLTQINEELLLLLKRLNPTIELNSGSINIAQLVLSLNNNNENTFENQFNQQIKPLNDIIEALTHSISQQELIQHINTNDNNQDNSSINNPNDELRIKYENAMKQTDNVNRQYLDLKLQMTEEENKRIILEQKLDNNNKELEKNKDELTRVLRKCDRLENDMKDLEKINTNLNEKLNNMNSNNNNMKNVSHALTVDQSQLEKMGQELEQSQSLCMMRLEEINTLREKLSVATTELGVLNLNMKNLIDPRLFDIREHSDYRNLYFQYDLIQKALDEKTRKCDSLNREMDEYNKNRETATKEYNNTLEKQRKLYDDALDDLRKEYKEMSENYTKLKNDYEIQKKLSGDTIMQVSGDIETMMQIQTNELNKLREQRHQQLEQQNISEKNLIITIKALKDKELKWQNDEINYKTKLETYRSASGETRELAELRIKVREVEEEKKELLEKINNLESLINAECWANEAEKLQQSLNTINDELKIQLAVNEALNGEIEELSTSFEEMQDQNANQLKQITAHETEAIKLQTNLLKLSQLHSLKEKRIVTLTGRLKVVEEECNVKQETQQELEKMLASAKEENRQLLEQHRLYEHQYEELKLDREAKVKDYVSLQTDTKVLQSRQQTFTEEYKRLKSEKDRSERKIKRLEDANKLFDMKIRKLEESLERVRHGGGANEELEEENEELHRQLTCSVCSKRPKNQVIIPCGHCFCRECIDENLRTRLRKCPGCGDKFGDKDVHDIF